jgi:5-methyltetrahydropteroyltriglutamate--homocysteine methyltransferase
VLTSSSCAARFVLELLIDEIFTGTPIDQGQLEPAADSRFARSVERERPQPSPPAKAPGSRSMTSVKVSAWSPGVWPVLPGRTHRLRALCARTKVVRETDRKIPEKPGLIHANVARLVLPGDTMKRSIEKILTTHVGSLPRPTALIESMRRSDDGEPMKARLAAAVREIVAQQVAAGVDVVSDGETSKPSYVTYVAERLTGFDGQGRLPLPTDLADHPSYADRVLSDRALRVLSPPVCSGDIGYRGESAVQRDIENLTAAVGERTVDEVFLTAASPGVIALFHENHHYPSYEAYLGALADAMRVEYRAIHQAGLLVQIDCPDLAMGHHVGFADRSLEDFKRLVELHVSALNHAVAGIPPSRMRLHVCWGNYEGPHHRDLDFRQIVDSVLRARPSGISFPAANPRHEHEWRIWEEVRLPDGKVLLPGVIDSTNNFVEHPELVAERILRFTRMVGVNNVIASTDCGFSTFAGVTRVEPSVVWAKLAALAEGAKLASDQLAPIRVPHSRSRHPRPSTS